MNLLITGGAGFIGSAVIRHIIRHTRDSVINLDNLTYAGNLESLAEVSGSPRYTFEQVDICNRAELDRVFAQHQPDCVMHLAAESHVDRSIDSAGEFIQTNIVGTFNLLEAARAYWLGLPENRRRWFCSEWVGKALGLAESWRFSPNDLAVIANMGREEK